MEVEWINNKNHTYQKIKGFIGPLTKNETKRREINKRKSEWKKEQKRLEIERCPGKHKNKEPWDCGCSFNSCGMCHYNSQCIDCGKKF